MDWIDQLMQLDEEDIQNFLNQYEALGPLPGIIMPMLEAFFPFLPLVLIVFANVNAYDLWEGYILSWIGVVIGAFCVFLIARKFGRRFRSYLERKFQKSSGLFHWVETKGFTPIFLLSCFPFTPSALVNIVAGMSKISPRNFFIAIFFGKGVMLLLVSFIGDDIFNLAKEPWKIVVSAVLIFVLWLGGKKLESRSADRAKQKQGSN